MSVIARRILAVLIGAAAALLALYVLPRLRLQGSLAENEALIAGDLAHDFGPIAHGAILNHRFQLHNASATTLQLVVGPPSCGCTTGQLDRETLGPGTSAFLDVSIETAGRQGLFEVAVPLKVLNSEGAQTIAIRCIADVDPHFGIKPTSIDFGELRRGKGVASRRVRLVLPEGSRLEGSQWTGTPPPPYLGLDWDEPVSQAGETELRGTLRFDPNKTNVPSLTQLGAIGRITTRTDNRVTAFQLQVFAIIADYISATPSSIFWDSSRPHTEQQVEISAADESEVHIISVTSPRADAVGWGVVKATGHPATISVHLKEERDKRAAIRSELRVEVRSSTSNELSVICIPVLII